MAIKPAEIVRLAGELGTYKAELDVPNLLVRGFMAGMFIAMGATLATICATGVEAQLGLGIKTLIAGSVFPVGLIV